jgi:hypothetical protein
MTTQREQWKWLLRAAALGQLLLLAGVLWLAADHEAHERFHPDAGKADHECAVTLLAHGKTDASVAPPVVIVAPQTFFFLPLPGPLAVPVSSPEHLLPFACGPPRA